MYVVRKINQTHENVMPMPPFVVLAKVCIAASKGFHNDDQ